MQEPVALTEAQQQVVEHNLGPALVFAVAGAGKTTAMVHRIERLVREGIFPASQILATSFGKGNERDLQEKLQQWAHCRPVRVQTLHALGRSVIALAQDAGYCQNLSLQGRDGEGADVEQRLLSIAVHEARRRAAPYAPELEGIDRQDFLSYVDACKGNLRYADLKKAELPPRALEIAGQAAAPKGSLVWYLDLFRLYEWVRLERGVVTFADMLLSGWELLLRHRDVLEEMRRTYRCVLVDEYQDINLAQSEILDLVAAPDYHYMAIGDDDQTIYEWRGASPHFILDFARRYQARTYLIGDNFRSPAGPLLFANRVIARNRQRQKKQLSLTSGFEGDLQLHVERDPAAMAARIVGQMQSLKRQGLSWQEMAILVRLNAQTPYIEQALVAADIPFRVSKPFYNRWEIQTLIYYVRLAWVEWAMQVGRSLSSLQQEWFAEAWQAIYNRPKRYLSRELHDLVRRAVLAQGVAPTDALQLAVPQTPHEGIAENVEQLADDLAWLAVRLRSDAAETLRELTARLDYKTYLRENSGFPQTGEGRAVGVEAFVDYARDKGSLLEFMQHIRELARQKIGREYRAQDDAVTLTTIHGAKGLEWPVIFLAQCNQSIMPFNGQRAENLEEERRLFYVALTRSSRHLYLYGTRDDALSQFLNEGGWRRLLPQISELKAILARDPARWKAKEAWTLAREVYEHNLNRYFSHWWDAAPQEKAALAGTMQRFLAAVEAQDAWSRLGLQPEAGRLWQEMAPQGNQGEGHAFPGLQKLLKERSAHSTRPAQTAAHDDAGAVYQQEKRGKHA